MFKLVLPEPFGGTVNPVRRALLIGVVGIALVGVEPMHASADTFSVNDAGDAGDGVCDSSCTLRDAIIGANLTSILDTITFDITPNTISVQTLELPPVSQPVVIDGFSDPNSDRVELDGALAGAGADGFSISTADGSTIKGFVINGFAGDGVDISSGGTGNHIEGNYIGTNTAGTSADPNGNGVHVQGSGNVIGGSTPETRNIISGNSTSGVRIAETTAFGNHVEGNYIGTNAAGTSALGNGNGVAITSLAHDNVVGGATAALRNVISGNNQNGVRIFVGATGPPTGNLVKGNYIGTNFAGTASLGNLQSGVLVDTSSTSNTIGGSEAGAGNLISGNGSSGPTYDGIRVVGDATTKNALLGNSIHSNSHLGIDLEGTAGVTANDPGDADVGPNKLQNFPVLTSAFSATRLAIGGTLNSEANKQYRLEFFSNVSCDGPGSGEGQSFIGTVNVATDAAGSAAFGLSLPVAVPAGQSLTATATDPDNNTSEFSQCRAVAADTAAPSTPTTDPAGGTFQTETTFTVTWSTSADNLTGIFGYDVRYREAPYNGGFGTHVNWQNAAATKALATTTATSATFTGTPGSTYCFSARAIDGAGNASPYGAEGCTAIPVDNPTFKHRGRWAKKTGDGYYLNTFSRTKREGARLTLGVQATVLSIIVTKCRRCGTIKVFFRGKLLKKIRLRTRAATRQKLRFVNLKTFASPQAGTVRVRVVSKGKLVIVEGLAVSAV
jgi:hypothetical protein